MGHHAAHISERYMIRIRVAGLHVDHFGPTYTAR